MTPVEAYFALADELIVAPDATAFDKLQAAWEALTPAEQDEVRRTLAERLDVTVESLTEANP